MGSPSGVAKSITPAGNMPPVPVATQPSTPAVARSGCRVMNLSGEAQRGGQPLVAGVKLDAAPSVVLGAKASLHLVHTTSARQWTIFGPARLLACEGGAEELTLASGTLRTEPGTGVRPGAEVWVGTPYGSLRYSDGQAEIRVGERELSVRVSTGEVWFTPLAGDSPEERRLTQPTTTFAARTHRLAGEPAMARCGRDAALAAERARALLEPSGEPLGKRAAEHVRARQRAHATCASARAALLAEAPRDQEAGSTELARYEQLWRGVPEQRAALAP